ncbi:ABC transporter ATP-binding protein [Conexibacter woesei]|uniref:Oligopeptide/dipeptide ABC transporter, ATPase subunit n=1 Tax=Conexibacter woesei (strain DSM 14684 / CCUG 47730 / CIP 108061 / JCM 11494 / NBRC 100937 / ID131577) TaxID=469383 RepID=D3FDA1_CONWI|nr:ABC transporter ATP-binding protein [Conexibacter woesei]ADB53493.1 oligopeptide/dipeptide ABC transporter, ATPase subunit [Conexibacter woesei DSM 14684]
MPDATPATPVIEVEGLVKRFDARRDAVDVLKRRRPRLTAVDGVSFELAAHETLGIVGESGSGKSTLGKCLVKLHEADAGAIRFGETDVRAATGRELAAVRRKMQMVYQDPYSSLNPLMTVAQAVGEPAKVHGLVPDGQRLDDYVGEVLEMVGLPAALGARRPGQLSGGQRQRVAIARAMAARPELLIADEPVSALDVSIQAQVLDLFERLRSEQGVAIVFIAHQLSVVAHVAERVMVMYLGRVVESGPAAKVFTAPGHPYTRALLESQPGRERRSARRQPALSGEIPSPLAIPSGCRFRTRCPLAQEICAEVDPAPADLGHGHSAWCHFAR